MLDQLLDAGLQIGTLLLMSLGGYAVKRGADWLKLSSDSQVRAYLNTALANAIEFGVAEARRRALAAGGDALRSQQPHIAVELARDYALARVPDALARFGIGTNDLDAMIRARMPKPSFQANG